MVQYIHAKRTKRVLVPVEALDGDTALLEDLEAGQPQSAEWEDHIKIKVSPEEVSAALRGAGIWTVADAYARPERFQRTITRLFLKPAVKALAQMRQEEMHGTG